MISVWHFFCFFLLKGSWNQAFILFLRSWNSKSTKGWWKRCKFPSLRVPYALSIWHEQFTSSYMIHKQKDPSKAHQIKMDVVLKALKWLEMDMDIDEVPQRTLFFLSLTSILWVSLNILSSGGMHYGYLNIQKSHEGLLCSQKQSGGS